MMEINSNITEKTDQELVSMTFEHKENYAHLITRYEDKLRRYILRLSGGRVEDTEDILQDVFVKVYKNLNGYDSNLKFSSWIYRIAHNETITFLRKINRRPTTYNFELDAVKVKTIKEDLNIEEAIDQKQLSGDILKIINSLNPKYKDVLLLRYVEDKDYSEISDILRKPPGTVATLLRKAKDIFKQEILKNKHLLN